MLLEITVGSSTVQPSTSSTSDCGSIVKYTFLVKTDLKMHLKVIPIISTYKSSLILFLYKVVIYKNVKVKFTHKKFNLVNSKI